MNRLAPLIVRTHARPAAGRTAALAAEDSAADLRFFATAFLGGLVFFGTLIA
jgi:hypothetical protein